MCEKVQAQCCRRKGQGADDGKVLRAEIRSHKGGANGVLSMASLLLL